MEGRAKGGRWRRVGRWVGRALALVLLLAATVYLTRERWLHPFVVGKLEALVAERLGAELEVGSFESSWVSGATLRRVSWRSSEPPLLELEVPLVRARWSLPALLTGDSRWLRELEAEVERIELATGPPKEPPPDEPSRPIALPEHLPAARVRLGHFTYRIGASSAVEVEDARLRVAAADGPGGSERFELTAAEVTWRDPGRELSEPLELAGRYDRGRFELERSSLGSVLELTSGELDLSRLQEREIVWSGAARALGGELGSSGRVFEGATSLSFTVGQARLASLEDALGPLFPERFDTTQLPVVSVSGRLAPRPGGGSLLTLEWVEARTPQVVLRGVDLQTPLASGDWRAAVRAARGRIVAEDADQGAGIVGLPPLDVQLFAELAEGRAAVGGQVLTAGGSLEIERGEVVLGPVERLLADARAELGVRADFADLAPLGLALGMRWEGALRAAIDVTGPLLAPTGQVRADASEVAVEGFRLGQVELSVVADGGRVDVLACDVESDGWGASLSGRWSNAARRLDDVMIELSGGGLALGPVAPRGFTASVAASGPLRELEGAYSLSVEELGLTGLERLDARAGGTFHHSPEGTAVAIDSLLAEEDELALSASGECTWQGAEGLRGGLAELDLTGPGGGWKLAEATSFAWRREPPDAPALARLEIGPLRLRSRVDAREGSARLALADGGIAADFEAFELGPLRDRLLPPELGWGLGTLEGHARVQLPRAGSGERPTADFDLGLTGVVAARGGRALPSQDLTLAGALTPEGLLDARVALQRPTGELALEVRAPLDLAAADHPLQPGPVSLRVSSGPVTVDELGPFLELPDDLVGTLELEGELSGEWSALRGELVFRGTGISSSEVQAALEGPVDLALAVRLGERVHVERGLLAGPPGPLLSFEGTLDAEPDVAAWITDPSSLLDATVALHGEFALPLEGWTERVESVRRLAGELSGTLNLGGTLARPDPSGTVRLEEVELRLASAVPSIRDLNAELTLNRRQVDIRSMRLEFGGAPCTVTGSVALPGVDGSSAPAFDLELKGENLLIARSSTARLRADADLTIDGPLEALQAAGSITITEGRFAQDVDILSKLVPGGGGGGGGISSGGAGELRLSFARTGPLATTSFDVQVRSEGQVVVKGNLYDFAVRPELTMYGTGEVPMFEGEVYVDPSTISLPSTRLMVESGVVRFSREDPFRPRIALSAAMETKGYDIDARIDGPIGNPEILLTSSPPLPNDQLLLLFLTGQTPTGTGQGVGAAQAVGVYLAQDVLVRWLGGGTTEADSLLDNLVFEYGAEVSHSGAPTITGRYYLDSRRKRTGRTTYLTAEKDVWDKTNFGYGIRFRFE